MRGETSSRWPEEDLTQPSHCMTENLHRRSGDINLCPMLTDTRLSRLRRHHCSTSDVQVALKNALRTLEPEQARKTWASCSLKPVLPSSKSLSDSSTTSHSTLGNVEMHQSRTSAKRCRAWVLKKMLRLSIKENKTPHLLRSRAGGSCLRRKMSLFGVLTRISAWKHMGGKTIKLTVLLGSSLLGSNIL